MTDARRTYHEELERLEGDLLRMGQMAAQLVEQGVEAFQQGDTALAEKVIGQDDAVHTLGNDIENRALRLIALQQPVARDLRLIGTALKATTDLERVADHGVDIAKAVRKLALRGLAGTVPIDVGPLAETARTMLGQSLEALVRHDDALAQRIVSLEDTADDSFRSLRDQLLNTAPTDASHNAAILYSLLTVVALERIADHAVALAERVHYVETGYLEPLARRMKERESAPV